MDLESWFAEQRRGFKVEKEENCLPSRSWESISSESGDTLPTACGASNSASTESNSPAISEAILVRLVENALQGSKSALLVVEKLSAEFCLSPADRHSELARNLWNRSSSSNALGQLLKSIFHFGCLVYYLHKFVDFYLPASESLLQDNVGKHVKSNTLVNQAFAAAVRKVLDGYICALATLSASVRLRHSMGSICASGNIADSIVSFSDVAQTDITVLEVFLHTNELRTHIQALGFICFPEVPDQDSWVLSTEDSNADSHLRLCNFPRGAELLTYLYVHLRDADPVHYDLLKFLFVRTCEPYCGFIKSWIYRARIDDVYEEFFVKGSDGWLDLDANISVNSSLAFLKEQDCISVPSFLENVRCALLRAGQQLQVLLKLLNLCNWNSTHGGACDFVDLSNLEQILPNWGEAFSNSLLYSLTFDRAEVNEIMRKRELMFITLLDNLYNFFKRLDFQHQQMNYNVIFHSIFAKPRGGTSPHSVVSEGSMTLLPISNERAPDVDQNDGNPYSSNYESSCDADPFSSSECSSLSDSEENTTLSGVSELPDAASQSIDFLVSILCPSNLSKTSKTSAACEKLPQCFSNENGEGMYASSLPIDHLDENVDVSCQPMYSQFARVESSGSDYLFGRSWLLRGLERNYLGVSRQYAGPKRSSLVEDGPIKFAESTNSDTKQAFVAHDTETNAIQKSWLLDGTLTNSLCSSSYDLVKGLRNYQLGINPSLSKSNWLPTVRQLREEKSFELVGSFCCTFNFSSINDPCKAYLERKYDASPGEDSLPASPKVPVTGNPDTLVKADATSLFVGHFLTKENISSKEASESASGGAYWERNLKCSCEGFAQSPNNISYDSVASFEIPVDIIIDKCITQEILLQYNYLSVFTMKLLEEGFDLHEHFLVLRRYHFMESADWADMFVSALRKKKWHVAKLEQRTAEIQGLLDVALQKSSCRSDHYRDRLFVHKKEDSQLPLALSLKSITSFDYIGLGFRVEWPVSIIVSPEALKVYTEIFSFLIKIRLAALYLADAWHSLKKVKDSGDDAQLPLSQMDFNLLITTRQQINHFVSALQQYVHSQLLHALWNRFQCSVKNQVKDILDLESVHMSYLEDALHVCFLSGETKPIAAILTNVLQSALDFCSCLCSRIDGSASTDFVSQVFSVKNTFHDNLKDLYRMYIKCPKHSDFSLPRFWGYLDYNGYYSTAFSKWTDRSCLY